MHTIPWDLITSIIIAALGSQWLGQYLMAKREEKRQIDGPKIIEKLNALGEKIDALDAKTDQIERAHQASDVDEMRWKILCFDGEMRRKIAHTGEEFAEILRVIDAYETYCEAHPEYHNSRAKSATENIKNTYKSL